MTGKRFCLLYRSAVLFPVYSDEVCNKSNQADRQADQQIGTQTDRKADMQGGIEAVTCMGVLSLAISVKPTMSEKYTVTEGNSSACTCFPDFRSSATFLSSRVPPDRT